MRTFMATAALTTAVALFASTAFAAPAAKMMTDQRLDSVVGGTGEEPPPPPPEERGDNGWGNGADGTNPGSDNGGTAPSKMANGSVPPGLININPTTSSGR